jgi:hypothetical protein
MCLIFTIIRGPTFADSMHFLLTALPYSYSLNMGQAGAEKEIK